MMKNKKLIKKIIYSVSFVVTLAASIIMIIFLCDRKVNAITFFPNVGSYTSAQSTISSSETSNDYISMTEANSLSTVANGKIISISTPTEYNLFAEKCSSTPAFLGYHYELFGDIDFASSGIQNVKPIGYDTAFTGQFNGNGYEIKNIQLLNITTSSNTSYQYVQSAEHPIQYFALFSKNTGTGKIRNLGLTNPSITISYTPSSDGLAYVAPFVGYNSGTVSHCYTKETRSRDVNSTGIYTVGGFYVSGFASVNEGTITDVYTSRTILSTTNSQGVIARAEILNEGTQPVNSYFYDSTINSYNGSDGGTSTIRFNDYYVDQDIQGVTFYGNYCNSISVLTSEVVLHDSQTTRLSVGSWYNLTKYSTQAQEFFSDNNGEWAYSTPIARGIVNESNMTFTISNNREFSYMFELFKLNKNFATSRATYNITANIDMGCILAPSYYQSDIGATITGKLGGTDNQAIKIYNAPITDYYSKTIGIDCFGVFPWLTGEVSYIDVVIGNSTTPFTFTYNRGTGENADTNKLAIGAISGYVDGGSIDHCNVYINVSFDNAIGKYYFGGIVGMIGSTSTSTGILSNSTVTGTITQTNTSVGTVSETVDYLDGMSLGGAVGYLDYTSGSIDTVLADMDITSAGVTGHSFHVGGIVASGYSNKLNQLHFKGSINLSSSSINYSSLYVAGVCARLLGMASQADYMTNWGTINVYQKTDTLTYVSGVMNSDVQTPYSAQSNSYLTVSKMPLSDKGSYYFNASSLTNKADITISNPSSYLNYVEVLNNKASNRYITNLSGLYNLQTTNDITLKMDKIPSFAPVFNNIGGASSYPVEVSTAYNFKNINITMNSAVTNNVTYAGFALGEYVNYQNIHNLGNIAVTVSYQFGTNNNRINLIVSGITKEISEGFVANKIYNAGNITVNYSANVYGDIYASGICYANKNGFNDEEIKQFDPASDKYQSDATGSINSAINNGAIEVTNPNYSNISYASYQDIKSANDVIVTERHYHNGNTHPSAILYGDTNVSGIVNYNYSVITNTFNIADLFAANYIRDTQRNEINVSGLVTYNIGKYAVIENSANDGVIKAINLSFYMVFSNGQTTVNNTTAQYAFVNASGIVCHNDETDTGTIYDNAGTHSKQIIAFTINYGSVYSYNVARNAVSSDEASFRTISAGILGMGLLNLVNVVNYGNIYGSEVSGGIVGVMFFSSFNTEVNSSNKVTLANTINYANVLVIDKGELGFRDETLYYPQNYTSFRTLNSNSTCYHINIDVYSKDYFNGSIFGIINFAGNSNAENVIIRYLISFNKDVSLVGAEAQTPDVNVDLSTFYSAYIHFDGSYTLDTYIGLPVVYSPVSTGSEKINNTTYYGVFNENFSFRKAMAGEAGYLDISRFPTDSFISDYFEFVGSTYVNETLLNTIGWGTMAYSAAAESFATSIEGVSKFVDYINEHNSSQYNSLINDALDTETWISKCDKEVLVEIVEELFKNETEAELLAAIQYIFSRSSSSYSLITTQTRGEILELLLDNDNSLSYESLFTFLIDYTGGYSSLLANSVIDDDGAGEYLRDYLSSLSQSDLKSILMNYCTYLKSSSDNAYFTYGKSPKERYDVLSAIFNGINDSDFYTKLASLLGISTEVSSYGISDELVMYNGYSSLTDEDKITFYKAIILYNSHSNFATYINEMDDEINYYLRIINNGYMKASLTAINTDVSSNATSTSPTIVEERIALWNQIRNTQTFKNYLSTRVSSSYLAKATEVNNTYQTVTYPYEEAWAKDGDLSFTYTFNITPATYFLGPYKSDESQISFVAMTEDRAPTNEGTTSTAGNNTRRSVIDVATKEEADFLYNNGYTYAYQIFYYEYSDSSSNNQMAAARRQADDNDYGFTWFKTGTTTDFTGGFLNGTYDDANGTWDPSPFFVEDEDGVEFDINGGGISKFTSNTSQSTGGYTAIHIDATGWWVITDKNQKQHRFTGTVQDWADFIIAHEIRHYVAFVRENVHPTRFSGLEKRRGSDRWIRWPNYNERVETSQYIYYDIDQLLSLDGYLSFYDDGTTKSDDERDIINTIFNTYLVTDSSNFQNVIAGALLESTTIINNDSYYYFGTPTYNNPNKVYYRLTPTLATSYDSNTKYYSRVGNPGSYDYIEVDSSKVNSSNYGSYYIVNAVRVNDYYNYTDCYQMKEVDGYDLDYINDFVATNIYTSTRINSLEPFEFLQYDSTLSVEDYLKSLSINVTKDKLIAYCVDHQNVYAKLLIKLLKFNELVPYSLSFPISLGNSTDPNAIQIEDVSSYDNLSIVNETNIISGKQFDYGYTFDSLEINLSTNYNYIQLYLQPTNGATTIYYSIDGGSNVALNVSTGGPYTISLNSNSKIKLLANEDVIFYQIGKDASATGSMTIDLLYEGYEAAGSGDLLGVNKPGYIIYPLPTYNEVIDEIETKLENEGISYTNISFTTELHAVSMCNSGGQQREQRYHRFVIDDDGKMNTNNDITIISSTDGYMAKNIRNIYDGIINNSYLGKSIGLMTKYRNNNWQYWEDLTAVAPYDGYYRIKIYEISLTISFTYLKMDSFIGQSEIYDVALVKNNITTDDYCATAIKSQPNYSTRFNALLKDATYNLLPIDYAKQQYINTLTSSTYYIDNNGVKSLATGEYSSTTTYYTESGGVYTQSSINESTYYQSMTSSTYYVSSANTYVPATGAYNSSAIYYVYQNGDYIEHGISSMNLIDLVGLNETHNSSVTPDYCIPELLEKLITTSNEAFISFVNNSITVSDMRLSDYEIILRYLVENVGSYCLDDFISSLGSGLSNDSKNTIASAYIVTDYRIILKNETSVYDSILRGYINNNVSNEYRYIESTDPYYDKEKFEDFAQLIGYSLATTGYGIYALASSYGIQDGTFIPDNLVLSSMNPYYDSSYNIVTTTNSYWRRGSGSSDEAVTDTTSVNYAFYEEMKQLKKSISTAIIELDLTDGTNVYMSNNNQTTKSGVDGTITYYVTSSELADISTSLDISSLVIANKAKLYINNALYNSSSNKTISVTKNGNSLTTTDTLKVVAEEESVYTIYDIIFIIIDATDTFTLTYSDATISKNYAYTGGTVDLLFTSLHLRQNIDLTPYITITGNGNTYNYLNNRTVFKQYFSYYTYGKYQITNASGDAEIKFEVFQELPAGTYTIKVQIGSNVASVTLVKAASNQSSILEFEFDNASVSKAGNIYSSEVLFGRVFNETDLTIASGTKDDVIPSYLSKFEISPNATYSATPSYSYNNLTGLITYRVTYVITAESGATTTYYHDITERAPFNTNDIFATVYLDGDDINETLLYTTTTYDSSTHDLEANKVVEVSFTRDLGTPEYRIYYTLNNFYISSNNFSYADVTVGVGNGLAAITDAYAGYSVQITSNCDVGTYLFEYNYHSESIWGSDTLERNYKFPILSITKQASLDSWINNLSLIDDYLSESTNATKISYEKALVPNANTSENQTKYGYNATERYYSTFANTDGITMDNVGDITYQSNQIANKNYFILGNVSDASLSNYQPTIKINEYAEIYQYLTDIKANGTYGANQTSDDTTLLLTSGSQTIYLYIPYYYDSDTTVGESEGDEYKIFLVKLEVVNGNKKLTSVYSVEDGIYDSNGDLNQALNTFANLTIQQIHDTSLNRFTTGGKTYIISSSAGTQSNSSLNMNYIGSPKDGHFWYVSYAVFSESYLKYNDDITHVDFYHIAIVDLTNNIYFTIRVNVPQDFNPNAIYLNINYVTYDNMNEETTTGIAVYAIRPSQNSLVFETQYDLAMLPSGYYTFTLELPGGYQVSYTASSQNRQGGPSDNHPGHNGAYLPPSSVVPIEIDLEFTVSVDNSASSSTNVWGIGTSSTRIVTATYSS